MTNPTQAEVPAGKHCRYCGGAGRFQIVSPVSDHAWADCFCSRAQATPSTSVQGAEEAEEWKPHLDYAGEPMHPGEYRDDAALSTPPAPASVADEASGLLDQLARDVAAFAALPKPEQAMLQRELATIGCNPGLAFAAGDRMPDDVRRLVIAARVVAYGDREPDDFAKMERVVEAFADRVGWDDEPEATEGTPA